MIYTNWNKQTYWKDPGEGHKKGKVAWQTSKINPHPLLLRIMIHHYMYMTHTTHITNNFLTLINKRPNGFPIIGLSLSFVTLIIIGIVVNAVITEQKESKELVHVTKEYTK